MKNTNVLKFILVSLIAVIIMGVASTVFADDNVIDLTDNLVPVNNATAGTSTGNGSQDSNNTVNNTVNNTTNNKVNNTLITNTYNNTALPSTGVADAVPAMVLLVVFGISAVYAYKKVQDYKNI